MQQSLTLTANGHSAVQEIIKPESSLQFLQEPANTPYPEPDESKSLSSGFVTPLNKSHPEDGGSMGLRNVGILPQHYTASQPRRPQIFTAVKTSNLAVGDSQSLFLLFS
jgi:hypothetical protein